LLEKININPRLLLKLLITYTTNWPMAYCTVL
jgi:hypothetical protein